MIFLIALSVVALLVAVLISGSIFFSDRPKRVFVGNQQNPPPADTSAGGTAAPTGDATTATQTTIVKRSRWPKSKLLNFSLSFLLLLGAVYMAFQINAQDTPDWMTKGWQRFTGGLTIESAPALIWSGFALFLLSFFIPNFEKKWLRPLVRTIGLLLFFYGVFLGSSQGACYYKPYAPECISPDEVATQQAPVCVPEVMKVIQPGESYIHERHAQCSTRLRLQWQSMDDGPPLETAVEGTGGFQHYLWYPGTGQDIAPYPGVAELVSMTNLGEEPATVWFFYAH